MLMEYVDRKKTFSPLKRSWFRVSTTFRCQDIGFERFPIRNSLTNRAQRSD